MLRLVSILLTTALLTPTLHKVMLYFDYEVNKEYITVQYCENKNKPGLHCEGKCEMMKRLNQGIKKELPAETEVQHEIQLYLCQLNSLFASFLGTQVFHSDFSAQLPHSGGHSVFHPPAFA